MPATRDDIAKLKSVLYMLRSERVFAAAGGEVVRKETIGALERAIALLEEGAASSPVFWVLGAISRAWERQGQFSFKPIDEELNQWALEQIHQIMRDDDSVH